MKHRGTFADWLMSQGVNFHPDTVIINAESVFDDKTDSPADLEDDCLRFPFKYSFWEGVAESNQRVGFYARHLITTEDCAIYNVIVLSEVPKLKIVSFATCNVGFDSQGRPVDINSRKAELESATTNLFNVTMSKYLDDLESRKTSVVSVLADIKAQLLMAFLYKSLKWMHAKSKTIELVSAYPQDYVRRTVRDLGKEPSPYFMLQIHPDKPRTKYERERADDTTSKTTMPETLVRGHVRIVTNHPIEQFNGVWWIDAHTRGNKENGQIAKGYTIILPKN